MSFTVDNKYASRIQNFPVDTFIERLEKEEPLCSVVFFELCEGFGASEPDWEEVPLEEVADRRTFSVTSYENSIYNIHSIQASHDTFLRFQIEAKGYKNLQKGIDVTFPTLMKVFKEYERELIIKYL